MTTLLEEITARLEGGPSAFAQHFQHMFLVRQPKTILRSDTEELMDSPQFEYRTATITADTDGFLPWEWWVVGLVKRPGAAFPDSLSVGRTVNSDIMIPQRFISKLHARFHLKAGHVIGIEDCHSSNGTCVNGRRLPSGQVIEVQSGDRLRFGSLDAELLDPESCYISFRARRHTLPTGPRVSKVPPG